MVAGVCGCTLRLWVCGCGCLWLYLEVVGVCLWLYFEAVGVWLLVSVVMAVCVVVL